MLQRPHLECSLTARTAESATTHSVVQRLHASTPDLAQAAVDAASRRPPARPPARAPSGPGTRRRRRAPPARSRARPSESDSPVIRAHAGLPGSKTKICELHRVGHVDTAARVRPRCSCSCSSGRSTSAAITAEQLAVEVVDLERAGRPSRDVDARRATETLVGLQQPVNPAGSAPSNFPMWPSSLPSRRVALHAVLAGVGGVNDALASTPKLTTPLGISRPFTRLSLPMLFRNLPCAVEAADGAVRRIARQHEIAARSRWRSRGRAAVASRQVSGGLPAGSKISIWPASPA